MVAESLVFVGGCGRCSCHVGALLNLSCALYSVVSLVKIVIGRIPPSGLPMCCGCVSCVLLVALVVHVLFTSCGSVSCVA